MGVDTSFRIVISQIINMKSLPLVYNAYGMIIRKELARDFTRNQDIRSKRVVFATRSVDKSSIFCIVCNKSGHLT